MKLLYDFYPMIGDSTSATITYSGTSPDGFGVSNLFDREPVRSFKTVGTGAFSIVIDMLQARKIDSVFLNRINFSSYSLEYSTDNTNWSSFGSNSNLTADEIKEDKYVHDFCLKSPAVTARYVRLNVPANVALFDNGIYRIGHILIGKSVDILDPKNGFQVRYMPNMNVNTFKSGHISRQKLGRTRRQFVGDFDKLNRDVVDLFRITYRPFAVYFTHTRRSSECYLVMNTTEMSQSYDYATVKSMNFTLEEIV